MTNHTLQNTPSSLRIATRKSPLALWQAEYVKKQIEHHFPKITCQLIPIETEGDLFLSDTLAALGGKGNFVKALEKALLANEADIAVHSMKDVPVTLPHDLMIGAYLTREDPRDAFISTHYKMLHDLPQGAKIGTASLRRTALLKHLRPDLQVETLRGNVQTRLHKLNAENFDAIILAAAGLQRLNLTQHMNHLFDPQIFIPAINQGILGIECCTQNTVVRELLNTLNDPSTQIIAETERAFNRKLGGACHVPVAGFAQIIDNQLHMHGMVADPTGYLFLEDHITGPIDQHISLGIELAKMLLALGARKILESL